MADFFGRNMPAHRHDGLFQTHYVWSGTVYAHQFHRQAPIFLDIPPMVTHALVTESAATATFYHP